MKWALVALLSLHGLIHLLGFVKTWGIVDLKALSDQTTIPLAGAPLRAFGLVWLAVCAAFLLAGALLTRGSGAWLPVALVAAALSPSRVSSVEIVDRQLRSARVIVPDYQLSLAIGREGQNARLAAKLTGWRIDIRSDTEVPGAAHPRTGDAPDRG